MATGLQKPKSGRGAGVSGKGTADETPKKQFYAVPDKENDLLQIPLGDITANPFNDDRDLGTLTQLAESIKLDGLVQEIAVMHTEVFAEHYPEAAAGITTKYVLAFGERRWRAHEIAGLTEIASVLRNSVAPKIRRILFIENFHRKPLTPMEEARRFHRMHVEEEMTYQEIVDEVSLSGRNYVSRRLDLMKLPSDLHGAIESEELPITHARKLLSDLSSDEDRLAAWRLMQEQGYGINEAISHVQGGGDVPRGNNDVPEPRSESDVDNDDEGSSEEKAPANRDQKSAHDKGAKGTRSQRKQAKQNQPSSEPDHDTADRNRAAADRSAACQHILAEGKEATTEQAAALYARCLLIPMQQGPARSRALMWLRAAGKEEIAVTDTDSYFQAVVSSERPELVSRVTFATALAAGEIRARDGRRQWDATDAQHVQLLIAVGNYHPETEWERRQLAKFGIPFPGADEAADPRY